MDKRVKKMFTKVEEGEKTWYRFNKELIVNIKDDREASKFLADVIRYWHERIRKWNVGRRLFCHDYTWDWVQDPENPEGDKIKQVFPEEEWRFSYKVNTSCGSCLGAHDLLDKIFGSKNRFNRLPYAKYLGDRNYELRFDLLKAFIEDGHEKVDAIKDEEDRKAAEEEQRQAEEDRKWRLNKVLKQTSRKIPAAAHDFLADIASRDRTQIIKLDLHFGVVIVLAERHHWSGASAVAHYSQVHVFKDGASAMKEWQYRDQSGNEAYQYKIDSIGLVETYREGERLIVNMELETGEQYCNLQHAFSLEILAEGGGKHPKLSEEELAKLRQNVERERARIRKHLDEMRERKPRMLASLPNTPDGYQNYSEPKVSKATVLDTGIAYFTTEEQIAHRTRYRQMRHELYVMKPGDKEARRVIEDHAWETERDAFVRVISINPDEVTAETSEGKNIISLRPVEA